MLQMFAMFESPTQWIIVLVIVLLLFGGSRIPEIMKGLGSGMREFKKGMREDEEASTSERDAKKDADKEAAGKS